MKQWVTGFALVGLLAVAGCGSAPEPEGVAVESLSGTNATIDNTNTRPWLAPVGKVSLTLGSCSGTLVGRTRVLTAGHCFDGEPATDPTFRFTLPNGSPIGSTGNVSQPIVSWVRVNNGSDPPHDIAVATLAAPIGASVIPTLPHIFTGSINDAFVTGKVTFPAIMVGFGGTLPTPNLGPQPPPDGNRRFGNAASDLRTSKDECGDLFEAHCNDDYEIEQNRVANPQPEKGDSGGPLYATDQSGNLVIIGVFSGFWNDYTVSVARTSWAPTGAPGGLNNGQWISDRLGGDLDEDGVLDDADNCPPSLCAGRGWVVSACANANQADDDTDGIGDVCDNCRKTVCDSLAAKGITANCSNPSQADLDADDTGDRCDLCPDNPARAASDTDGDGVGDVCDACPGMVSRFPPCVTNADCPGSACVKEPTAGSGTCADLPDSDGDTVPDACDACPAFSSAGRDNSNKTAEKREFLANSSVKTLPDACDPVPLVRVAPQQTPTFDTRPTLGDGQGPDEEVVLQSDLWVGADLTNPSGSTATSRRVTYRHCDCFDPLSGAKLDQAACVGRLLQCDWAAPASNAVSWKKITVVDTLFRLPLLGADGWSPPQPFRTNTSTPQPVAWQWRTDAATGKIAAHGTCPGTAENDCETHGAIFTGVEGGSTAFFSIRDAYFTLRDTFQMFDTPKYMFLPRFPTPVLCWGCFDFLVPGYKDPFPEISGIFDRPAPIFVTPTSVAGLLKPGFTVDLSSMFTPSMRESLAARVSFLSASESRRVIRGSTELLASSIHVDATLLDRDYVGGAPQYFITAGAGFTVIDPLIGEGPGHTTPHLVGGPPPLTGVTGVYSQLEANVYMVGGRTSTGLPSGAIWKWSMVDGKWSTALANTRYRPSSTILGTAYDSPRQHLYVLDVDDNDRTPLQRWARLLRFDLATQKSVQVLRVPYAPLHQHITLSALEDGTLALVAADALSYTAWRLEARSPQAQFLGVAVGLGTVLDQPAMGEDRLYLPVNRLGQLVQDELTPAAFLPGAICSGL